MLRLCFSPRKAPSGCAKAKLDALFWALDDLGKRYGGDKVGKEGRKEGSENATSGLRTTVPSAIGLRCGSRA